MLPGLADAKLLVVKIGSALVVDGAAPRTAWLASVAADVAAARARGTAVILVSSGAIALARRTLGLTQRRLRLEEKQAAAAVGQIQLAQAWAAALSAESLTAAQMLLTLGDTEDRRRYLNARATLSTLLGLNCVPVINENDSVATTEIRFGDNDRLAARVAEMVGADRLLLLSDIDGLYTADPRTDPAAQHIPVVPQLTPEIEAMGGEPPPGYSSGGMRTKLVAARIATQAGCAMAIALGTVANPIEAVAGGCALHLVPADARGPHGAQTLDRGQFGAAGHDHGGSRRGAGAVGGAVVVAGRGAGRGGWVRTRGPGGRARRYWGGAGAWVVRLFRGGYAADCWPPVRGDRGAAGLAWAG